MSSTEEKLETPLNLLAKLEPVFAVLVWATLLTIAWVWVAEIPFLVALPIAAVAGSAAAVVGVLVSRKFPEDPVSLRRYKVAAVGVLSAIGVFGVWGAARLSCCEPAAVTLALVGASVASVISYRLAWFGPPPHAWRVREGPLRRTSPWRLGLVGLPGVLVFGLLFALSPERWTVAIVGPVAGAVIGGTIRLLVAEPDEEGH
ncbi:MAG: hypothetical protein ACRDXD_00420 [Acidimicrobiia bacterium]